MWRDRHTFDLETSPTHAPLTVTVKAGRRLGEP
jgi:hypothetical protein